MMKYLFIPTDRIGFNSYQDSISHTTYVINQLLKMNVFVCWHFGGFSFDSTSLWPEGHYYQCGYSMKPADETVSLLSSANIIFDYVDKLPEHSLTLSYPKIALYDGSGAGPEFSAPLAEVMNMGNFSHEMISDTQIRAGKLMEYDIFLVPGSPDAGECYYRGLGDRGFQEIRRFLKEKGNYMGICGGAYLPLSSSSPKNPYWLNIMEATEDEDLDFWHTGSAFVRCRIDEPDHPLFAGVAAGKTSSVNAVYWEGPCIHILGDNVRGLGHFESLLASGAVNTPYWEMADNDMADQAVHSYYNPVTQPVFDTLMKGRTSFAEGSYKGHKLLLISPHPEMGNIGYQTRKDSLNFLLVYNGLFYLSAKENL